MEKKAVQKNMFLRLLNLMSLFTHVTVVELPSIVISQNFALAPSINSNLQAILIISLYRFNRMRRRFCVERQKKKMIIIGTL
jgi:hypothetical protein